MFSLVPLLGKSVADLTIDDLRKVAKTLNLNVELNDELRTAGLSLLKGEGIDKVADLIQKPESVQKLLAVFQPKVPDEPVKTVLRCPHCHLFFF